MLSPEELIDTIARCRVHESAAQYRLYHAYHSWAHAVCKKYTRDEQTAYECVQDGFFKALTKLDHYGGNQTFGAWFKRILINTCIDRYRSSLKEIVKYDIESIGFDIEQLPEVLIDADAEHLLMLVRQLPPVYQMTFNLYAIEGYSYAEIAEMLSVKESTTRSNLFKARTILKDQLLTTQKKKTYGK